jgi:uncharacterized protein
MQIEHKLLSLDATQFKFNGDTGVFEGYASVFGGVDAYGDTIHPGAYKSTIENRERPIRMRWNHFGPVIGKYTEILEDSIGLFVKGQLTPGHSVAEDVKASLLHGAIDGMSIGYMVRRSEDKPGRGKDLYEIDLVEISVVEEPADLGAKITNVKAALQECKRLADIELILRNAGFSRTESTALISRVKSIAFVDNERKPSSDEYRATFGRQKMKFLLT